MHAAPGSGSGMPLDFNDLNDRAATAMGQPLSGNLLDNAYVPDGEQASIASFVVQGSLQAVAPGGEPVTLSNPYTGLIAGRISIRSNGRYAFVPVPGYVRPLGVPWVFLGMTSGLLVLGLLLLPCDNGRVGRHAQSWTACTDYPSPAVPSAAHACSMHACRWGPHRPSAPTSLQAACSACRR